MKSKEHSHNPGIGNSADPIFAAIEAHKAAIVARELVIDRHSALDRELPVEKCHSVITAWKEIIVETDDPRWIECERALAAANDAELDAAIALVTVKPTTGAGVLALLQYAVTADADGQMWLELPPGDRCPRSWHHSLVNSLIEVLPGMVTA